MVLLSPTKSTPAVVAASVLASLTTSSTPADEDACSVSSTISVGPQSPCLTLTAVSTTIDTAENKAPASTKKRVRFQTQVHFRRYKTRRNERLKSLLFYTKAEIQAMKQTAQERANHEQFIKVANTFWKLHQECINSSTDSSNRLSSLLKPLHTSHETSEGDLYSCFTGLERSLSRPVRQDKIQRRKTLFQITKQQQQDHDCKDHDEERIRQECERITLPSRLFAQQVAQLLQCQEDGGCTEQPPTTSTTSSSKAESSVQQKTSPPPVSFEVVSFTRNISVVPPKPAQTPSPKCITKTSARSAEIRWSRTATMVAAV